MQRQGLGRHPARLLAWLVFVLVFISLAYVGQASTSSEDTKDVAYRYDTTVLAIVQYGVILGILLLIARGLPRREAFGLHRPASWGRARALAGGTLAAIWIFSVAYDRVLSLFGNWNPTEEQGLV